MSYPRTLSDCDLQEVLELEGNDFSEQADREYVEKLIAEILWLRMTVRELSVKNKTL
jgi:hypothetical protein